MAEKGSLCILLERQVKSKLVSKRIRRSCMGTMDLEINVLTNDRREAQAVKNWLCAVPSFCVHVMAEPGLKHRCPHLAGRFSCPGQHTPSRVRVEYFFLVNISPTKEVNKVNSSPTKEVIKTVQ